VGQYTSGRYPNAASKVKRMDSSKMKIASQKADSDPWSAIADKYSHPDDTDINESLVRALEAKDDHDRKLAIEALIALNDLYAASRIYWVVQNGSKHARMAAVEVLGRLCHDTLTIHALVKVNSSDKSHLVRRTAADALIRNSLPATSE
jgi:HEAT repeat protein